MVECLFTIESVRLIYLMISVNSAPALNLTDLRAWNFDWLFSLRVNTFTCSFFSNRERTKT